MTTKKRTKLAEAEARVAKQWPGLSKHRALSSFPKRALEKGAAVESEHVGGNKPLARRIAADHLVEDLKYYDKLAKQEAKMKKQKGRAAGRTKGDPTDLNLSSLNREVLAHEARGDKTLHRFSPTSMNAMRRLLKAGYLAPAVGQPGHWVLTGQGEMALEGFRQREAATAARWAKPGHAAGEAVVIPEDPRVECFTKAISGALKKLAARIEPKGFRLHDISYGTTLYNQGRGVIAGVPGARVSFQAVGPRGARVHFHGSFRYDREDYLVGTLTVSGAESKREWSLTRGKCAEVAKLIAAPSTFPRHAKGLSSGRHVGLAAGKKASKSSSRQSADQVSPEEYHRLLASWMAQVAQQETLEATTTGELAEMYAWDLGYQGERLPQRLIDLAAFEGVDVVSEHRAGILAKKNEG